MYDPPQTQTESGNIIQETVPLGDAVQVAVLRTVPEIEQLRDTWESWPGNRDSQIDFYLTVLRSQPETVRPHVIVVYREGKPDAIFVGRLDRRRLDFRIGYIRCRPKAAILYFVYGALRGHESLNNCKLLIHEIESSLSRGEADAAYLNLLKTDSNLYKLARELPGVLTRDHISVTQAHFSASIPGSVKEFYAGLSPRVRKHAKSRDRRIANDFSGGVRVQCFRQHVEVRNLIEDVEQVARSSYQRGLGVGFIDSAEMRDRLELKAQMGWLRSYVLYLRDRPAAFLVGDVNRSTFGVDYTGYDPEFTAYSPGTYLILKIIEDLARSGGISAFDFGPGDAEYKRVLSDHRWAEGAAYIFARSLKGMQLKSLRLLTGTIDYAARKILGRAQLLRRIKKSWRNHARRGASRTP